jgi:hypothetical protein
MTATASLRTEVRKLGAELRLLTLPAADVLDEPVTRYLFLGPAEGAVSLVSPARIRSLILRTRRRHRRRLLSSVVVHAFLYGDPDINTGPLLNGDRLPASVEGALYLAATEGDGEYLVVSPAGETRIRVEGEFIDEWREGRWEREYRVE